MRRKFLAVLGLAAFCVGAITVAALASSPAPTSKGLGPGASSKSTAPTYLFKNHAGDHHGAVGRTHTVLKVNDEIWFVNRSTPGATPTPTKIADTSFWGATLGGTGGVTALLPTPTGTATPAVHPDGDGRIYYDPYPPTGCGTGGHWLAVEMANVDYGGGVVQPGILIGISAGEDPLPGTGKWYQFFEADPTFLGGCSAGDREGGSGAVTCPDFPQLGFNTNWIAINTDYFYANGDSELLVFPRAQAECSGIISSSNPPSPTRWPVAISPDTSSILHACPAETYHEGTDPDGASLYLIRPLDRNAGTARLMQITGTPSAQPTINYAYGAPALPPGTFWYWPTQVSQPRSITLVDVTPADDRFSSCVVRDSYLWAAHHIGVQQSGTPRGFANMAQWWKIGVGVNLGQQPVTQRIPDAIDPSIGVNSLGDMLVGFSLVNSSTNLSSGYQFVSHLDIGNAAAPPLQPFLYQLGGSPYKLPPNPKATPNPQLTPTPSPIATPDPRLIRSERTGDYSHTVVDPLDDTTFWTTEGYAGSVLTGTPRIPTAIGWRSSFATVTPPQVVFEGFQQAETEAPALTTCDFGFYRLDTLLNPPPGAKDGDVLIAVLEAGVSVPVPILPSTDWKLLTMSNVGSTTLTSQDQCSFFRNSWIAVHKFSPSDSVPYDFGFLFTPVTTCYGAGTCFLGESTVFLTSYRGASVSSSNFSDYVAYGYPNDNSGSNRESATQAITAPASRELLTVFSGTGDMEADPGELGACETFVGPFETPKFNAETPLTPDCDPPAFLATDVWTGNAATNIKAHSVQSQVLWQDPTNSAYTSALPAWQVLIPPAP